MKKLFSLGAAAWLLAAAAPAAAEDYSGFNVNYDVLLAVEDETGAVHSAEGSGLLIMLTDCINWTYNQSLDLLLKGEGTNFRIGAELTYSESVEGTHGFIFQDLDMVSSSAAMPGGEVSLQVQYERQGRQGDGVAFVSLSAGDQSLDGGMEIHAGELLPIEGFKLLVEKLRDGEEEIAIRISALGALESMEPRQGEELYARYEVVDSPFTDYELPETYDDVFAGESWAVRAVLPPAEEAGDPEELIFEIYESGAISFWLVSLQGVKVAFKPSFASLIPDPGCS